MAVKTENKFWTATYEIIPVAKEQGFGLKNHTLTRVIIHHAKPTLSEIEASIPKDELDRLVQVSIRESSPHEVGEAIQKGHNVIDLTNDAQGPLQFSVKKLTAIAT